MTEAKGLRFAFETMADRPALHRFARRLRDADASMADWPLRFSWNRLPGERADNPSFPVRRRRMLAWYQGEVRTIVNFFEQQLFLGSRPEPIPFIWCNGLVSESAIDRRYSVIPVALLQAVRKLQPRQLAMGPIGTVAPMPRLYISLRWQHQPVPVLVLPVRAAKVVRELRRLAAYPKLQALCRAGAATGLGSLADAFLARLRQRRSPRDIHSHEVDRFADWSDEIWCKAWRSYGAVARRDAAALDRLYRPGDPRLIRLKVSRGRGGAALGWAALAMKRKANDPDYGNLSVGLLADSMGRPEDAGAILYAGVERLVAEGADLIQTTLSHKAWVQAARQIGFLPVPTTTNFFVSPAFAGDLPALSSMHLTLGDCDGPLEYDTAFDDHPPSECSGHC